MKMKVDAVILRNLKKLSERYILLQTYMEQAKKDYTAMMLEIQGPLVKERAIELRARMLLALKKARCRFKEGKKGFTLQNTTENFDAVNKILLRQGVRLKAMKCSAYGDTGVGYDFLVPYAPHSKSDRRRTITLNFPETWSKIFIRVCKKTGKIDASSIKEGQVEEEEGVEDDDSVNFFSELYD